MRLGAIIKGSRPSFPEESSPILLHAQEEPLPLVIVGCLGLLWLWVFCRYVLQKMILWSTILKFWLFHSFLYTSIASKHCTVNYLFCVLLTKEDKYHVRSKNDESSVIMWTCISFHSLILTILLEFISFSLRVMLLHRLLTIERQALTCRTIQVWSLDCDNSFKCLATIVTRINFSIVTIVRTNNWFSTALMESEWNCFSNDDCSIWTSVTRDYLFISIMFEPNKDTMFIHLFSQLIFITQSNSTKTFTFLFIFEIILISFTTAIVKFFTWICFWIEEKFWHSCSATTNNFR